MLALALVGCGSLSVAVAQRGGRPLPAHALVVVDGDTLHAERFEATYDSFITRTGQVSTPALRRAHLDALVDEALLAHEAVRRGWAKGAAYDALLHDAEAGALAQLPDSVRSAPSEAPSHPDVRRAVWDARRAFLAGSMRAAQQADRTEAGLLDTLRARARIERNAAVLASLLDSE